MLAASAFGEGAQRLRRGGDEAEDADANANSADATTTTTQTTGLASLCEACAHDDDIAPLLRLVFEAQEAAAAPSSSQDEKTDPKIVVEDGRAMCAILASTLASVAERASGQVQNACERHSGSIADASAEVVAVGRGMARVRRALAASNADVQASGRALSRDLRELRALAAVRGNLKSAAAALASSRAVLEQCLEAGELVDDAVEVGGGGGGELHAALALLDALSRKELAALLALLVAEDGGGNGDRGNSGNNGSGGSRTGEATTDPWAIFSGQTTAKSSSGGDNNSSNNGGAAKTTPLPDGPALARAFAGLVAGLRARIQSRALAEFDAWLLAARGAAREVGMSAVRAAARERALEEDLADERRRVLRGLLFGGNGGGGNGGADAATSIEELAERLADAPFRAELLREAAAAAEAEDAEAAVAASAGGGGGAADADAADADAAASPPRPSAGPRGIAALREAGLVGSMATARPTSLASSSQQRPAQELEEEEEEARSGLPPLSRQGPVIPDVARLRPGESDVAVRLILARHARRGELDAAAHKRAAAAAAAREDGSSGPGGALLRLLDMRPLLRALHVHRALGPTAFARFRARYSEQRALQAAADLQPPPGGPDALLDGHQPYLAQVVGFFAIEAYVARVTDGLVAPGQGAALWAQAQGSLKATLERALGAVGGGGNSSSSNNNNGGNGNDGDDAFAAARLLLVKDFVLLACQALERASPASYRAAPVLELLASSPCSRYHWLLARDLGPRLQRAVLSCSSPDDGAPGGVEVATPAQHRELALALGLPASLLDGGGGWSVGRSSGGGGGGGGEDDDGLLLLPSRPGRPRLPYTAPYSAAVPAALKLVRRFVADSVPYLRGLFSDWELPAAAFAARDRALAGPLSRALAERLERAVASTGGSNTTTAGGPSSAAALRAAMRCAADAWALRSALDALDEHTAAEASPPAWRQEEEGDNEDKEQEEEERGGQGVDRVVGRQAAEERRRRRMLMRRRRRRHAVAMIAAAGEDGGGEGALAAALRSAQDAAEDAVLRVLTARVSQILAEARRSAEWAPAAAVVGGGASGGGAGGGGGGGSSWPDALVSFLRETMDAGSRVLPPDVLASLVRRTLRAAALALTDWLAAEPDAGASGGAAAGAGAAASSTTAAASSGGAGALMASFFAAGGSSGGYNLYAVERLAVELAAVRRHVLRWGHEGGHEAAGGGGGGGGDTAAAAATSFSLLRSEHAHHLRGLALELAEPEQLCALLLSGSERLAAVCAGGGEGGGSRGEFAKALQRPLVVAASLERLRETPAQAKRHPQWPTRKEARSLATRLRGGGE